MSQVIRLLFVLGLVALAPRSLSAQQAAPATVPAADFVAAPQLTPEQQLRLRVVELQVENAQLRVALAQAQLDLQARDAAATVKGLERDGFTLSRGEREWQYVPVTKEPKR